jgi:anaerobic magnesium-protoporphyrin IX monomethyl ester cyclase
MDYRTDILLGHSNLIEADPKQLRKMRPYPPLATLYAASVLREAGHKVALYDPTFADSVEPLAELLSRLRPRALVLVEDSYNYIAKMCLGVMREAATRICRLARAAGARVVVAGPDATGHPEAYLDAGADLVLVGDADAQLPRVMELLLERDGADLEGLAGVVHRGPQGELRRTPRQDPQVALDGLPDPAWDLVDIERYRRAWTAARGTFDLNLVGSRGCPYRCVWCAKTVGRSHYDARSPRRVAEEMAAVQRQLSPDRIWFADDIFGLQPGWLPQFADAVGELGVSLPYTIQTRVDLLDEVSVAALRRSGCSEAWLGIESGSQRIIDQMNKGIDLEAVPRACRLLREGGIRVCLFFQFGFPGETLDDIRATVRLIRELQPDDIGVSVSYPLKGTDFYDRVAKEMGRKRNWRHSNDLAAMFQTRYSSPFYRQLHRVLHLELELVHRLRGARRPPDAGLLADLGQLNDQWMELGRLEVECRGAALRPGDLQPEGPPACVGDSPATDGLRAQGRAREAGR